MTRICETNIRHAQGEEGRMCVCVCVCVFVRERRCILYDLCVVCLFFLCKYVMKE